MFNRAEAIRERAGSAYDRGDALVVCPNRILFASGAEWGAAEALTYTNEDVERVARSLTPSDINPDLMGVYQVWDGGSTDEGWKAWIPDAIAALESMGMRRIK